jgi:hypothetical protein
MSTPDTRHEWVSVKAAAIHFGTSESDIRRRIKRGELESESLSRPGGTLLRVKLPAPPDAAPIESPHNPDTRQDVLSAVLGPLTDALASERAEQRAERQKLALENAELREDRGRLRAEAAGLKEALDWTEARRAQAEGELERMRRPWWRRLLDG